MKKFNFILFITLTLIIVILTGSVFLGINGKYHSLIETENSQIVDLKSSDTLEMIVKETNSYYKFSNDAEVLDSFVFEEEIIQADFSGDYIYTYSKDEYSSNPKILISQINMSTREVISSYFLDQDQEKIAYIATNEKENYIVSFEEPTIITYCDCETRDSYLWDLGSEVLYLDIYGDKIIAFADSKIYYLNFDLSIDHTINSSYVPITFLSENVFVDRNGSICMIDGEVKPIVNSTYISDYPTFSSYYQHLHCTDGEYLYFASDNETVVKTDYSGNTVAKYKTDSSILGITCYGAIVEGMKYTPFSSFDMEEEIDKENLDEEQPETIDVLEDFKVTDNYIILDSETTVSELSKNLQTDIYMDNEVITDGNIKTGMSVVIEEISYTLVIKGDTNASGTINSSDMTAIQNHLVEKEILTDECLISADISENGLIEVDDLVLLEKIIK